LIAAEREGRGGDGGCRDHEKLCESHHPILPRVA
jgi:hypothetical protein